jgi:hypothetical protein
MPRTLMAAVQPKVAVFPKVLPRPSHHRALAGAAAAAEAATVRQGRGAGASTLVLAAATYREPITVAALDARVALKVRAQTRAIVRPSESPPRTRPLLGPSIARHKRRGGGRV